MPGSHNLLKRKKTTLSSLCLLLVLCFLSQDIAYAYPDAAREVPARPVSAASLEKSFAAIPPSVASIDESALGRGGRTIILLQDAHTNPSAQLHAARVLELLSAREPLRHVFLEAGSGDVSLSFLNRFSSPAAIGRAARSFVLRGELQGSEYFNLVSAPGTVLWGVEDPALYERSVRIYRRVARDRGELAAYLDRMECAVEALKPATYNPFLYDFDRKRRRFEAGLVPATEYFDALVLEARRLRLPVSGYKTLASLRHLKSLEASIDFKSANAEAARAVSALGPEARGRFLEAGRAEAADRISDVAGERARSAYFGLLEESVGRRSADYPELEKYFRYLRRSRAIDARSLLDEQKALEDRLVAALAVTPEEEALVRADSRVRATRKLLDLSMTPSEFDEYRRSDRGFGLTGLAAFVNRRLLDRRGPYDRAVFLERVPARTVALCEAFYRLTLRRDRRMAENMAAKMEKEGLDRAVLVAGGYHAPSLKSILREKGFSFVSVVPAVLGETDRRRYEEILLSQTLPPLSSAASPASTNMPYQMFMRAAAARLASQPFPPSVLAFVSALSGPERRDAALSAMVEETVRRENFGVSPARTSAARLAAPSAAGSLRGLPLGKLRPIVDRLSSYGFSAEDYEAFGDDNFEGMRAEANRRAVSAGVPLLPATLEAIPGARVDTWGRFQAERGGAIHEIVKNAADFSTGPDQVARHRSSKHGQGAMQILGELAPGSDYAVVETHRRGRRGVRVTLWNEGESDYRVHYALEDVPWHGTKVSVFRKLDDKERGDLEKLLVQKLRFHTAGPIRVNGRRINTPEDYRYAGPAGGGTVDESVSEVEVTIGPDGWSVLDRGLGMDLKAVLENFLYQHASEEGDAAPREAWTPDAIKRFSKPEPSRLTRVAVGINGHEVISYSNPGEPRLNLARELILDFPYGVASPTSWNRVEFDDAVIRGLIRVAEDITDPSGDDPAAFSLVNSLALFVQSLHENPRVAEVVLPALKARVRAMVEARRRRGQTIVLVPNRAETPASENGWTAFDDASLVALDPALFDFDLSALRATGRVTDADPAFREGLLGASPTLRDARVPVYVAAWGLEAVSGSAAVWVVSLGRPALLVDPAVYAAHREQSLPWFEAYCAATAPKVEAVVQKTPESAPVIDSEPEKKPARGFLSWVRERHRALSLFLAAAIVTCVVAWSVLSTRTDRAPRTDSQEQKAPATEQPEKIGPVQPKDEKKPVVQELPWHESAELAVLDFEMAHRRLMGVLPLDQDPDLKSEALLPRLLDDAIRKRTEAYRQLVEKRRRLQSLRESGHEYPGDWSTLAELARRLYKSDTVRKDMRDRAIKGRLKNLDDALQKKIEEYKAVVRGFPAELQRDIDVVDLDVHKSFEERLSDFRATHAEILRRVDAGDKKLLAQTLYLDGLGLKIAFKKVDRRIAEAEGGLAKRYALLESQMFVSVYEQVGALEEAVRLLKKKEPTLEDLDMFNRVLWKSLEDIDPELSMATAREPGRLLKIQTEIERRLALLGKESEAFRSELNRQNGDENQALQKGSGALTVLIGFALIGLASLAIGLAVWLRRSQSLAKYGSQSPFEEAGEVTSQCGAQPGRLPRDQKRKESQVYGRVENPLPGHFNGYQPLIVGYFSHLDKNGVWQKSPNVGKEVHSDAKTVGKPTVVTLWGDVKVGVSLALPNYPYGIITDIAVLKIDENGKAGDPVRYRRSVVSVVVDDGKLRVVDGGLRLGKVAYSASRDEIEIAYTGRVMVTYNIRHYDPENIFYCIDDRTLSEAELQAVDRRFGKELREHLKKSGGDPVVAARNFLKEKCFYAADETKALSLPAGASPEAGTWIDAFFEQVKDGRQCAVICNTAALLNAIILAYYRRKVCYVTQIVPSSEGGLFSSRAVLTKNTDGHAAILTSQVNESSDSAVRWYYEESVANVGPRPIMLDTPRATVGIRIDADAWKKKLRAAWSFAAGLPAAAARRGRWLAALAYEAPAYRTNVGRVERALNLLHIEDPKARKIARRIVFQLYMHNARRFIKTGPRPPRLEFYYLDNPAYWPVLERWSAVDPAGLYLNRAHVLRTVFSIGDGNGLEWLTAEDGSFQCTFRGMRRRWSPMNGLLPLAATTAGAVDPTPVSYFETAERLLEKALREGGLDDAAAIINFSTAAYFHHLSSNEMPGRLLTLALEDPKLARQICNYLLVEPRLNMLADLAAGNPRADQYYPGRERVWAEWIASGGGLAFDSLDRVEGLSETDDLFTFGIETSFPDGMSLGRVIDAARWHEENPDGARLSHAERDSIPMDRVRRAIAESAKGRTTPAAEREMLATISSQDRSRMVMIRELIQNSRDALRRHLARVLARGAAPVIEVRSFLHRRGADIFWVLGVKDPVGMDRKTLFEKYFPPKATTKSVQQTIAELLRESPDPRSAADRIAETLVEDAYREDAAMRAEMAAIASGTASAADLALEILKKYSARFKQSLSTGFFGVGNYTVYADADDVVIRTGLDGQADEVWLRVDRSDPADPQKVTGITVLSWKTFADPGRRYEGTLVQRLKKVSHIVDAQVQDRIVKYLFAEYVGAIDPSDGITIAYKDEAGRPVPVHDPMKAMAAYGGVRVRESSMGIRRVTVDDLFIQSLPENDFLPGYVVAWEEGRSINVDYPRGTPVVESRTSLLDPAASRHAALAARAKAAVRGYREGTLTVPGLPAYRSFLRDPRFALGLPVSDASTVEDMRRIESGTELTEERWSRYRDGYSFVPLFLMLPAPGFPSGERSLLAEKENLFFGFVPVWLRDAYFADALLRRAFAELPGPDIDPVDAPEAFSRATAVRLFRAAGLAYRRGALRVPGLPETFSVFAAEGREPGEVSSRVAADAAALTSPDGLSGVDFAHYASAAGEADLASLLTALSLEGGKSLRDFRRESIEQARRLGRAPAAPVRVVRGRFAAVDVFESMVDRVLGSLARELPEAVRARLPLRETLYLDLSADGLETLRFFAAYRSGEMDARKFFDAFLDLIFYDLDDPSRTLVYDALLRGDVTAESLRREPATDLQAALDELTAFVSSAESRVFFEKTLAAPGAASAGARLAAGRAPVLARSTARVSTPAVSPDLSPKAPHPAVVVPASGPEDVFAVLAVRPALADGLDAFAAGTGAPGRAIAVDLDGQRPSILAFRRGRSPRTLDVFVGGKFFKTVSQASASSGSRADVAYADAVQLLRELNRRYDRRPSAPLAAKPAEAYVHLDGYHALPEGVRAALVASQLSAVASRGGYRAVHLVGSDATVREALAIVDATAALARKKDVFRSGEEPLFPDAPQIHFVAKSEMIARGAILRADRRRRFIAMDDVRYDEARRTVDVAAFNPVVSLAGFVGAMEELSKDDRGFKEAYEFFREITGFEIREDEFLGLLAGDEALVRRFALPPALKAVDVELALRVWSASARMAAQAA